MTYLEGLRVPVRDPLDRRHVTQPIRKLFEFLYTMGKADGEFLGEKL